MPPELVIPPPDALIPGFAGLPQPIRAAIAELASPFPAHEVRVRPGSVRRDGTAALALAYADWWTGYLPRLNDRLGPHAWSITLQPWGVDQIVARLTAFDGQIVKESTGSAKGEINGAQEAEVQAKKRVCAEGLSLGLFFYFLPKVWGRGERIGEDFVFAEGEEERCVYEMYRRAGLSAVPHPGVSLTTATAPAPPASTHATPTTPPTSRPERLAHARATLSRAEHQAGVNGASRRTAAPAVPASRTTTGQASERQRAAIVRLVAQALTGGQQPATLNLIGQERAGFGSLAELKTSDGLPATLSRSQASALITALQGLRA